MINVPSCCLVSHTLKIGVGPADANRLLAGELMQRGYRVSLCGLNDSSVTRVCAEEMSIHGTRVPVLNIPRAIQWPDRRDALRRFLEQQQPAHVIFRFIPYSLNPKGIVWAAAGSLPQAFRGYSVICLVDEIWLGAGPSTIKHRLVGALQRYSIMRMLQGVKPTRVYTNNRFNTGALRRKGVQAETLRLFGNIPLVPADDGTWLYHEFAKVGIPITPANRGQWLVLGNFGLFHSDWKPDLFFTALRDLARKHGRKICIAGIGSLGVYEGHWRSVVRTWSGDFTFLHLGRRRDVEVSLFLQAVDFGITTTPYHLVGKSGTCMAMLDHGLPIIVPRISEEDDPTEFPPGFLLRCGDQVGPEIFAERKHRPPNPQLPRTVDELVSAMSGAR